MAGLTDQEIGASPQKVVILGGGIGAISTAFLLTDPELHGRYEVTVHCMGWRLGGKGASGRNAAVHQRVEEHGLHIWFGAYRNAIAMMKACYKELGRTPGTPLAGFTDAFTPQNRVVLTERVGNEWRHWPIDFVELPPFDDVPTVYGLYELLRGHIGRNPTVAKAIRSFRQGTMAPQDLAVLKTLARRGIDAHTMNRVISPDVDLSANERVAESDALSALAQSIWAALVRRGLDDDRDRRFWVITYLGITIAKGILDDQLYEYGFDAVDDQEFREWLSRHSSFGPSDDPRADQLAFWSAAVQAFYDASFSYAGGDPAKPSVAASTGLRCVLRILFDFSESIVYKMQAGMGDTVFAPLYECLKKRGVQFEFFSRAINIIPDASYRRIASIELSRQVTVRGGGEYRPLVSVRNLRCWPNQPLFDQLVEGDALKASCEDLEHWNSDWVDAGGTQTLQAGRDFDWAVLAVSHAVIPEIAKDLCRISPAWKAMSCLESVATQAWQLWFRKRRDELGMDPQPEIFGGFAEPWSSIVDFSHVLKFEEWTGSRRPYYLVYSCGTLPNNSPKTKMTRRSAQKLLSQQKGTFSGLAPTLPANSTGRRFLRRTQTVRRG